jgi:hypothetical protein
MHKQQMEAAIEAKKVSEQEDAPSLYSAESLHLFLPIVNAPGAIGRTKAAVEAGMVQFACGSGVNIHQMLQLRSHAHAQCGPADTCALRPRPVQPGNLSIAFI